MKNNDPNCSLCGEPVEPYAGNPNRWPIQLPRPGGQGKLFPHHIGCVVERVYPDGEKKNISDTSGNSPITK